MGHKMVVQNHTIGKKIGCKSAIKHKMVHLTRKRAKIWGAKSLKKKEGCKIAQLTKDKKKCKRRIQSKRRGPS